MGTFVSEGLLPAPQLPQVVSCLLKLVGVYLGARELHRVVGRVEVPPYALPLEQAVSEAAGPDLGLGEKISPRPAASLSLSQREESEEGRQRAKRVGKHIAAPLSPPRLEN